VADEKTCKTAVAVFDYELDGNKAVTSGPSYSCRGVVGVSNDLDAAVLELEGTPGEAPRGFLRMAPQVAQRNDRLVLIQHPAGQPKQVSRKNCRVETSVAPGRAPAVDFGHICDTESGSSGAPVLKSDELTVIGLHHRGFDLWGRWSKENRAVHANRLSEFVNQTIAGSGDDSR
jgi:V8-like Glu-specific endopeptidase